MRIAAVALLVIPLRADTYFNYGLTGTYATTAGASAATAVTGDPAILNNVQSVCLGLVCKHGASNSQGNYVYNWSSQVPHGEDCEEGLRVVATTDHFFNNGSDVGSTDTGSALDCELVYH
ncbi:MAG: hypothetical protein RLN75_03105 [Longimicrobiales bacterium]